MRCLDFQMVRLDFQIQMVRLDFQMVRLSICLVCRMQDINIKGINFPVSVATLVVQKRGIGDNSKIIFLIS